MSFYKNKKILITGGTGMIGYSLTKSLIKENCKITVVSLDKKFHKFKGVKYKNYDLRNFNNCLKLCKNKDIVFHLAGIKGSPVMATKKPASFFVPLILLNTNLLEAARVCGVKNLLYTSSIGVYSPSKKFIEDHMWEKNPSKNDKYAGWAKRMGELQIEAYQKEYNLNYVIVRPANIYGPFDNFDPRNAMVIPSLINKANFAKNELDVFGDGSEIRDFLYSDDCAEGIKLALRKKIKKPINLGSGKKVSIKKIVNIIKINSKNNIKINWIKNKKAGDKIRVMDIKRAKSIGFKPKVSIENGIINTMNWFSENNNFHNKKYNAFKK